MRLAICAAVLFASLSTFDTASAAPAGVTDRAIDLDLKQADLKNVFALLSDVGERKLVLDPCVHGNVDLRLQNMPVSVVLDVLAVKLQLAYDDDGDVVHVVCKGGDAAAPLATTRVSLAETDAALPDVLTRLAANAKLEGVDYRATARPNVALTLRSVRLATALSALEDESGLKMHVVKNRLLVTD